MTYQFRAIGTVSAVAAAVTASDFGATANESATVSAIKSLIAGELASVKEAGVSVDVYGTRDPNNIRARVGIQIETMPLLLDVPVNVVPAPDPAQPTSPSVPPAPPAPPTTPSVQPAPPPAPTTDDDEDTGDPPQEPATTG